MWKKQVEAIEDARANIHPVLWRYAMSTLTDIEQKIVLGIYEDPPSSNTGVAQDCCYLYMPSLTGFVENLINLGLIRPTQKDWDNRPFFYELQDQGLIDYLNLDSQSVGKQKAIRDLDIIKKDLETAMQLFISKPLDENLESAHDLIDRYKSYWEALK